MDYEFDFFYVWKGLPILGEGLLITLELTLWATIIGTSLGFVVALGALSKTRIIRVPTTIFVEFFRCTPALIQLIWFFDPYRSVLRKRIDNKTPRPKARGVFRGMQD